MNQNTPTSSDPAPAPGSEQLQISDLRNLLMIVDVASQRGAFKGPELSQVGSVFDRVSQFLQSVTPQPEQATPAPPAEPVRPVNTPSFFQNQGNN